jgi:hypothetical protein
MTEMVEKQNEIIRMQAETIDELFVLLMQHMEVDEVCRTEAYAKMQDAANRTEDLSGKSRCEMSVRTGGEIKE